ncbi:MAG: alpha-amylase family glycosyl hydrolase, partial [Pseudoclavibacter sp.]
MHTPTSTYRLQLTPAFGFDEARAVLPYLRGIGVDWIYLSPILQAASGSTHGYDVVDPTRVCDALGGEDGFRALADAAHDAGMRVLVDIVPNHLGVQVPRENAWWWSVLEQGQDSPHEPVFDIDWHAGDGRILLPVIGDADMPSEPGAPIGNLVADPDAGVLRYHDTEYPLAAGSTDGELMTQVEMPVERPAGGGAGNGNYPRDGRGDGDPEDGDAPAADDRDPNDDSGARDEPDAVVRNLVTGDAATRVHARQHYRLVHWRQGDFKLNYRRFFTVTGLAGVCVEKPDVFDATHDTILRLVRDGYIDGLRIDHPDGLRDPDGYLERLADRTGGIYVVVEKILEPGERLEASWATAGTTGYDALGEIDRILTDPDGEGTLDDIAAARAAGPDGAEPEAWGALVHRMKRQVTDDSLHAEVRRI